MPKRPGSREILRVLERSGFEVRSQRGSHAKLRSAEGRTVTLPHPTKEIPMGTVRSILRQPGLHPSEFGF